eukprot:gene31203-14803_t
MPTTSDASAHHALDPSHSGPDPFPTEGPVKVTVRAPIPSIDEELIIADASEAVWTIGGG